MGAISRAFSSRDQVDFRVVSAAVRSALDIVVPTLLPGGYRSANEWIARNPTRNDARPGSFKVNMETGVWSDFATGDKGGDAIDLLVYLEGKTKLDAARELGAMLGVQPSEGSTSPTGNVRNISTKKPTAFAATPEEAKTSPQTFPHRTAPGQDGKPRFVVAGDEGPRIRDNEKRRHFYCQGGLPVRIKIIQQNGDALNVYRVNSADGVSGWQYRKPEGFKAVPYFVGGDPFEINNVLYWPEGEKDVDSVAKGGGTAFTFGGTGDGLPSRFRIRRGFCASYAKGHPAVLRRCSSDISGGDCPGNR